MSGDSIILIVVLCLFLIFSLILSLGKGSFLIAGYNMASEEEKNKFNEKMMTKFMGKMMFFLALCIFLWFYDEVYDSPIAFYLGLILFIIISAGGVIYLNTNPKFRK
ncbi:DUF3784 domain-containing protein [Rummeliibacillus pycnus]|uniref:DUF3784 domain-containing protein n=1 Tax=Rummeliibacillus pycnus TaxID=101070 RepID=UPI0037C705AB